MQVFFDTCENEGLSEEKVLDAVMQWCTKAGVQRNPRRSLRRAIDKGRCTESPGLLETFCRDELKAPIRPGIFDVTGHVPDYFGKFGQMTREFSARMELCQGNFEIVRPGSQDIERGKTPDWASDKRQVYDLRIWSPDGRENFAFRYSDREPGKKKHNRSIWVGHAFATNDAFYLIGVDPEQAKNAVMFILQQHPQLGFDLLVGMQLAKILDEDDKRQIGVSRRVAAFRDPSRGHQRCRLEQAAREWVAQQPMGAVITYRPGDVSRPRDL
jgi:hypothetical protein